MNLPRRLLSAALWALEEFATQARELLDGEASAESVAVEGRCVCGQVHEPGSAPATLLGLLAARQARTVPEDGPSAVDREWSVVFADKVRTEDLIAVQGDQFGRPDLGLRALRVKEIRHKERQGILGLSASVLVFALRDEDSGEPATAVVDADGALRIATKAPDSVPADFEGEA